MTPEETRDRVRIRLEEWRARLERLRAERKTTTGEARRAFVERLQELRAKIAGEVRAWNAGIDDYDADLADWKQEDRGVG